jgi:hypothetical protein
VLRPGGRFLWADVRRREQLPETRRLFQEAGFDLVEERLITPNVLRALDLVSHRKTEMIRRMVPRVLVRPVGDFAGVPGTRVYESLRSGAVQYVACTLRKPAL